MSRGECSYSYLVDLIGAEAAQHLSQVRGGRGMHIPKSPGPNSAIVQAIGSVAAAILADTFGGDELTVPIGPGLRAEVRRLRKTEGLSIPQIAERIRRTERFVYKVLAEDAPEPQTPPLLERIRGL